MNEVLWIICYDFQCVWNAKNKIVTYFFGTKSELLDYMKTMKNIDKIYATDCMGLLITKEKDE
ncbi:hypothetical protein UFOVP23_9 [uncultured Caudovirales phage]|uniref:Uncharacterized protein n=1 Tax=uncultured Caudovirales phage TaxID=2100421 RepID=A0A6J5T7C4_9CAUD|nr:hypothetical protein UFOVP23_9 [uncultured Caudovirales phage]